jgi:hypothetical protein
VAEIPGYLNSHKMPGGVFDRVKAMADIKKVTQEAFGQSDLIIGEDNSQLYFNKLALAKMNIDRAKLIQVVKQSLKKQVGFQELIDLQNIEGLTLNNLYADLIRNGYNPDRSGDVMILLKPQWFMGSKTGTTHSTLYAYDTHVPLLFYGWKVKPSEVTERTSISDISTSLANWLHCMEPSGSIGRIIPLKK